MSKITTAVALAAILGAATPTAFAQTHAVTGTPRAPDYSRAQTTGTPAALRIQSNQIRASKMIGATVYDVQNRDIGSVKDLVLNKDGRVADVVIDVGSFLGVGGKYVAVRLDDIKSDHNRLTLDRTKEQLQQMAAYHLTNPDTGAGMTQSAPTGGRLGR
jgi:sporulation protein YlmC with PRC-barrel domain